MLPAKGLIVVAVVVVVIVKMVDVITTKTFEYKKQNKQGTSSPPPSCQLTTLAESHCVPMPCTPGGKGHGGACAGDDDVSGGGGGMPEAPETGLSDHPWQTTRGSVTRVMCGV